MVKEDCCETPLRSRGVGAFFGTPPDAVLDGATAGRQNDRGSAKRGEFSGIRLPELGQPSAPATPARRAASTGWTLEFGRLRETPPLCILDEMHKYGQWKTFLKGCHDSYPEAVRLLVTGSARLDVFKAGGDSLMGRYFTCRTHPLSASELLHAELPDDSLIRNPLPLDEERFQILLKFGGFPELFLRQNGHEPN